MNRQVASVGRIGNKTAALVAIVFGAAWVHADDTLRPKSMLQTGQQWEFSEDSSQNMDMMVGGQGGQEVKQVQKHVRKGTVQVMAAKDGQPTSIKITFDLSCDDNESQNGQAQDTPFPLAGKTVVVRKDDLGIITIDGAATNDAVTKELTQMLTPLHPMLPDTAASVGDTWDANKDAMNKEFELGPSDSAETKVKYSKAGEVDGRKTADLDITGHIKKSQGGLNFTFELKGNAQLDLASGQALLMDTDGQMSVEGQTQSPQGQVNVQGSGTMKSHATMHLVGGGDEKDVEIPQKTDGNPLGGGGGDSPFAGDFHGDKLSANFTSDGQGGVKGTLQMGDQKFPATGKISDGKLVGSFNTQGGSFDFTATVDGNTLTLSSGGTDYAMKKAAVNPLSGGGTSQSQNPLGR